MKKQKTAIYILFTFNVSGFNSHHLCEFVPDTRSEYFKIFGENKAQDWRDRCKKDVKFVKYLEISKTAYDQMVLLGVSMF